MGARFAALTEGDVVLAIIEAALVGRGHWTITANLDHLRRYRREPEVKQLIDEADLVVADGMPLVWASRIAGTALPERVAGSDMIWSISKAASTIGLSIFLVGGAPGVADRAAQVLTTCYPGLTIVGTLCPAVGFERDVGQLERLTTDVADANPQIVLVALGFPKQDLVIRRLRRTLPRASFVGVGISLSFVDGTVSRAPSWTHKLGLEWIHRLVQEPRRLGRRYLVHGIPFGAQLLLSAAWQRAKRS